MGVSSKRAPLKKKFVDLYELRKILSNRSIDPEFIVLIWDYGAQSLELFMALREEKQTALLILMIWESKDKTKGKNQ